MKDREREEVKKKAKKEKKQSQKDRDRQIARKSDRTEQYSSWKRNRHKLNQSYLNNTKTIQSMSLLIKWWYVHIVLVDESL